MKKNKNETNTDYLNEKLVARFRSVFDSNTVVYEFESHFRIYALTGTGERLLGIAEKETHELPFG